MSQSVWCVFEDVSHDNPCDRDNDGSYLCGVYSNEQSAINAMSNRSKQVPVTDDDSHDEAWCRIETSKWLRDAGGNLYHDSDYLWWIEERMVDE